MWAMSGRGKRVGVWIACSALLLLAVACEDSAYGTYTAPPVVTSSALQPTIEQAQVDRYLSAIEAEETLRRYYADQTATAEARKANLAFVDMLRRMAERMKATMPGPQRTKSSKPTLNMPTTSASSSTQRFASSSDGTSKGKTMQSLGCFIARLSVTYPHMGRCRPRCLRRFGKSPDFG